VIDLRHLTTLSGLVSLAAALTFSRSAHAGPTLGADLDLGTAIDTFKAASSPSNYLGVQVPPALYDVGFRIRAGWRFDLGRFFIVPEFGVGYDVERESSFSTSTTSDNVELVRVLGGARAEVVDDLVLGDSRREVQRAIEARFGRDLREQLVGRAETAGGEHRAALGV